jgi:hypothetical protein
MLPAGCGWCVQTVAKIDRSWGRTLDLRRDAVYLSPKLSSHANNLALAL